MDASNIIKLRDTIQYSKPLIYMLGASVFSNAWL